MKPLFPNLFTPIKIGNLLLKNRIIAAPTGMMSLTPAGHLTDDNMAYYGLKAKGGAAVVTLGESIVEAATGRSHDRQVAMDDPHILPTLARTVKAINRHGAVANIELSHGGIYAGLSSIGGEKMEGKGAAYGPSAMTLQSGEQILEMPREMIFRIVDAWGRAAAMAKRAGFGMIMVHAGHGWLFNQFLSLEFNRRKDEFGGSLENRARFLMLALDSIRKNVGKGFPIELRMNGDDFTPEGVHLEEYKKLAAMLDDKIDLFHISCGSHEAPGLFVRTHPSMFLPRGCNVYLAAEIKKVVTKPVACVGALDDPAHCEKIISSGQADIVEIARGLIADPYFPQKAYLGKQDDITPCLRCFVCLGECVGNNTIRCTVNPVIGNELDEKHIAPPPEKRKRILIAGGGPAGMEAAITAAKRGHNVTLCEASDALGGNIKHAKFVDFKTDLKDFLECMKRRVNESGAEVRFNTPVTKELVLEENPDVLVIAVGSVPVIPRIPGLNDPRVLQAVEAEEHPEKLGKRIVVLGGGLVGCEAAINLKHLGKEVTIVEMRGGLAIEVNEFHQMALKQQLTGIGAYLGTSATAVTEAGLSCTGSNGENFIVPFDNIICAAGLKPRHDEVMNLVNLTPEYFIVGDCSTPRQITQAMSEAYFAMREI
jgi:2,4-dienoyl-CoA reductase-like NADH-dependent reductase (Old Yellow Enzyme family)/thioredoxin reductase